MRTEAPLLAPIFRSDAQSRLLSTVMLTSEPVSITSLAEGSGLSYATAHREVDRLLQAGILSETRAGRTRMVQANAASPLTNPLRQIVLTVAGPAALLGAALGEVPGVAFAFIYGSFAARAAGLDGPAPEDIDLMVVGDVDADVIYGISDEVSEQVGRPVNPTIMRHEELDMHSGFLRSIKENPTLLLVGKPPWAS